MSVPGEPACDVRPEVRPKVRIALDLLGADHPPEVLLERLGELPKSSLELVLVGPKQAVDLVSVRDLLAIDSICTEQFVAQDDSLNTALRRKPRSSMRLALGLLRDGDVDGVVSAGNTAALMAMARALIPRAPGLSRPAICKMLNGKQSPVWMLDLGANIGASARQLEHFALLGTALAAPVLSAAGVMRVRVGLLNIGAEVTKGPAVLGEAAELLKMNAAFDYVGFVESHELFDGRADVVVSDGLLGNVALKAIEGTASMAAHLLSEHIARIQARGGWRARLRKQLFEWTIASRDLADVYDPQGYNGASLLGLSGVVVKSHGRADGVGFAAAISQAQQEVIGQVPQRIFTALQEQKGDSR